MLYMPNSNAGIKATTTVIMVRFRSLPSWMWTPNREVVLGVNKKVSMPSYTDSSLASLPPGRNEGSILFIKFLNAFISMILLNSDNC